MTRHAPHATSVEPQRPLDGSHRTRTGHAAGQTEVNRNRLLTGDAAARLAVIESGSVDMVLTSPPYFRLRNYQADAQLGTEQHVANWITGLQRIAAELHRVLTPTGTLWLNLGDTYATQARQGAPAKSLLLAPERLASALVADGWCLRNKVVWHKPNAMPTSATDRLAATYEVVYVFAKQPRYYFDLDSLREPHSTHPSPRKRRRTDSAQHEQWRGTNTTSRSGIDRLKDLGRAGHPLGKNPGDVWRIGTSSRTHGHPATFPEPLARRAVRAGCPEARCTRCRMPWRRPVTRHPDGTATRHELAPGCDCGQPSEPGLVLDPFIGSGTTAVAATQLGRDWLGIELNPTFTDIAAARIAATTAETTASDRQRIRGKRGPALLPRSGLAHPLGPRRSACGRTDSNPQPGGLPTAPRTEEENEMSQPDTTTPARNGVKTLAIRLEPELHQQLTVLAGLQGRTITDEIRTAIKERITRLSARPDLVAKASDALAEIERDADARRTAIATLFGPPDHSADHNPGSSDQAADAAKSADSTSPTASAATSTGTSRSRGRRSPGQATNQA